MPLKFLRSATHATRGLIHGLKTANVAINRKMLADMAVREPENFSNLLTLAGGKAPE